MRITFNIISIDGLLYFFFYDLCGLMFYINVWHVIDNFIISSFFVNIVGLIYISSLRRSWYLYLAKLDEVGAPWELFIDGSTVV
jgi:hypothetical protein